MNLTGQTIDRYDILEQLGEGGMATVYKAYDSRLECHVAVKVIRVVGNEPQVNSLKRFEREAKALAQLMHPHIVRVKDYGEYNGMLYLVLDYLPGGTMAEKMGKPMHYQKASRVLAPIADALAYAHQCGVLHRDVKPSNILMTESGQPMLADFGIAKIIGPQVTTELTATGVGIGTPNYMAPEQWMGKAEERTDLYALGVVFYELVTGRLPYIGETPAAVLIKHVNDPLPNPRQFVPDLPEDAEAVIFKVMAKKPEGRFENLKKFSNVLEQLATGAKVDIGKEKLAESGRKLPKRKPVMIAGASVLIIALCALILIFATGSIGKNSNIFGSKFALVENQEEAMAPVVTSPSTNTAALQTPEPSRTSTTTKTLTTTPTNTSPPPPTSTPTPITRFNNFYSCLNSCDPNGSNSIHNFPERITRIYLHWEYENIPINAHYTRQWTMNGNEWIRYECTWPGPPDGVDEITLTEPDGLHSGIWTITIMIDYEIALQESIWIEGDWDYWSPVGVMNSCYGKK